MTGCRRAWVSLVCKITISVRAACAKAAAERHTTSASTNKFRNRRNTFSSSQARIFPGTLILNLPIYRWQGKQQPPAGPATCAAKTAKAAGRGACGRCEANPRGCKVGYQGLPFLRRTSAAFSGDRGLSRGPRRLRSRDCGSCSRHRHGLGKCSKSRQPSGSPEGLSVGAESRNRTGDTGIFSPVLYQLSYLGKENGGTDGIRTRDLRRDRPAC